MRRPIGYIPSWPSLVKEQQLGEGEMIVIPCGVTLGVESFYELGEDSVISRARRYLDDLHQAARKRDDQIAVFDGD